MTVRKIALPANGPERTRRLNALRYPMRLPGLLLLCACGVRASAGDVPTIPTATLPVLRAFASASEPVSETGRVPRHVALLIGIGDYDHFTLDGAPGSTDLAGPVNDVERMRASLRRWGFTETDDIRVLLDGEASKAGIEAALRWVAARATAPEDVIVLFYSGHGSYAPDRDGDESDPLRGGVPGDTVDEALVPADVRDIHDPAQLILDDAVRVWIESLNTSNVTLIVDACYSGTMTRGPEHAELRRAKGPAGNHGPRGAVIEGITDPRHTLITASGAGEVAEEISFPAEDRVFGVLTYHLTRALDAALPNSRYDELLGKVRALVSGSLVPQVPQLEGDRGARLFNVRGDVARRPFVIVTAVHDSAVMIDAGAMHGVRRSAIYDVHPASETAFQRAPLAQMRVDSVHERTSFATIIAGAGPVAPAARASLARVPLGAHALETVPVFLHADARGAQSLIEPLEYVRLVDDPSAVVHVDRRGDEWHVSVRGIEVRPLAGEDQPCGPIARAFGAESFVRLQNPLPPPGLAVALRVVPTGTVPGPEPVAVDTAWIDDYYDVYARVEAASSSALYLSVSSAGLTDRPIVLFPAEPMMPAPFPLNAWVLILPQIQVVHPAGLEVIKAVAGSDQYDLHAFVRSLPRCAENRSVHEHDSFAGRTAGVDGWTTADHRLLILPRDSVAVRFR